LPGPPPKAAAKRQRSKRDIGSDIGPIASVGPAPRMPADMCRPAQNAWRSYWQDVLSGVMRDADGTMVLRWVKNLDRYHRLLAEADSVPMVVGSTGQPKANPIYDLVFKIEASIKDDEKQLGIGPLNRLRLGVALSESAKSLADLNAEVEDDDEDDDPRAGLAILGS
jgi:P27 family predicted phage terminase small subunit